MWKGLLSTVSMVGGRKRAAQHLAATNFDMRRIDHRGSYQTSRPATRVMKQRLNTARRASPQRGYSRVEQRRAYEDVFPRGRGSSGAMMRKTPGSGLPWDAPLEKTAHDREDRPRTSPSPHYDHVNTETGHSAIQERFDTLVHQALLRYGPPLPVEIAVSSKGVSTFLTSPFAHPSHASLDAATDSGADDATAVYYDEVGLRPHELMHILRKADPQFSVRSHCDGVPFALMVKNCRYLRAHGGKVNYMRFVRRLSASPSRPKDELAPDSEEGQETREVVLSIGKYKMRELPSQDGVRQGPQPWRYSYSMM